MLAKNLRASLHVTEKNSRTDEAGPEKLSDSDTSRVNSMRRFPVSRVEILISCLGLVIIIYNKFLFSPRASPNGFLTDLIKFADSFSEFLSLSFPGLLPSSASIRDRVHVHS